MLIETFIRKQLGLKAHTVTKVEETERYMVVRIDRLGLRLLRCGVCRQRCRKVHSVRKPREWRDLSMRKLPLKLRYRPRRVECPRCGLRVEDFPWAEPWARVTTALSNAVARLARELSWQGTARQYGLNWKSVATIVKRAVEYGLCHRARPPVHVIGIVEVSRRKGRAPRRGEPFGWEREREENRRRCGNVEIALLAISKGGGRRWETRCRAGIPVTARREFSTGVHRPAFPQRSSVTPCGLAP